MGQKNGKAQYWRPKRAGRKNDKKKYGKNAKGSALGVEPTPSWLLAHCLTIGVAIHQLTLAQK